MTALRIPDFKITLAFCLPALLALKLAAQTGDWRAEAAAAQRALQASERAALPLARYVRQWRHEAETTGRSLLTGKQQAEWARLMAALNRNLQRLIAFSDDYERARKLPLRDFAKWNGSSNAEEARLDQLRLLVQLVACDRASYALAESLRSAAGNAATIINRLNEGNRSFGLQYGLFEKMNADFFDGARRRRTRSRYVQIDKQRDFLETIKSLEPEVHETAQQLLGDPLLQQIAGQSEISVLWENSITALAAAGAPAQDLMARTFHNGSQFFGNLIGTNLFRLADLLGVGESRGHDLPALHRYYPHPQGAALGVHPAQTAEMEGALQAGDVLFEKTRFAITDKLIPGYFGHVAIYLQSYAALAALGVFETEEMRAATNGMPAHEIAARVEGYAAEMAAIPEQEEWLKLAIMRRRLRARSFNGAALNPLLFEALYRLKHKQENVLEALRDGQTIAAHAGGVTLNRFAHFLYVDDYAAMRLKRTAGDSAHQENLARFLALALLQYGKPYDFRFDVNTLDAIVCSELIYQSFVDLEFATGKSLSSYTIAPDQVAQQAGYPTTLGTLAVNPPFELLQWYAEAAPLFPAARIDDKAATGAGEKAAAQADTLAQRAFMAMVREEFGGLKLLSAPQREQWKAWQERARQARAARRDTLRKTPAPPALATADTLARAEERRLQNLFITVDDTERRFSAPRSAAAASAFMRPAKAEEPPAAMAQQQERAAALAEVFQRWQEGPAYRLNYDELYSGAEKFFLGVFRGGGVMEDDGFGRGLDLQLAGNNEPPRRALLYLQYYAFLPFHLQVFDNSGKMTKRWQGGAALASIRRSYLQGDYVRMQALAWQSTAYASSFTPFAMEAGGDKGPLSALLKLATIGNGNDRRGLYFGEFAALTLAPYETRQSRSAFSLLDFKYGAKAQITMGKFRAYGRGALGVRLGKLGERKKQAAQAEFPEIREWAWGLELFGSSLYRPARHRLELAVSEDGARFIGGEIMKDRQVRISYSWLLSE